MRIAINGLLTQRPLTGTGQYTLRLLQEMASVVPLHEYDILGWHKVHTTAFPPGVSRKQSGPRIDGRWHNLTKLFWEQFRYPIAAAACRAKILHVPYWAPPVVSTAPVVVTIHDVIPAILPAYQGGRAVRAYTRLVTSAARRATAIIADSDCSRRDMIRVLGVQPERVATIHLAAGERFRPVPTEVARPMVSSRWGVERPYVLYLGATDVRKDVPTLIRAWARVATLLPGLRLVIGGFVPPHGSALYPDLPALTRQLGLTDRVAFLGSVSSDEQVALLSACRAFVYPSRYEGFGLPPLEAMACGAPVIVAKASSLPEVVGDAGLLFPPGDDRALSELMARVATDDDLRERLSAAGIEQARRFSWRATAEQTLAVYEHVRDSR